MIEWVWLLPAVGAAFAAGYWAGWYEGRWSVLNQWLEELKRFRNRVP